MSWGIDFKANVFISNATNVQSKYEIEYRIENFQKTLACIESNIKMMCVGNVKDYTPEEEDVIQHVKCTIDEYFDQYNEYKEKIVLYKLLLENYESIQN